MRKLRKIPKVKKVFIRSGIRFDYLMADKDESFFRELVKYHISGQLKVAPEHVADKVLAKMGKPEHAVYQKFVKKYEQLNRQEGMNQFLVPYLMSSHPGCSLTEAVELAEYLRDLGYMPEQVQDFYPTPSTISTCMYYTGVDPRTMEPVYVPKNPHEKAMQRALIQYRNPANYELVKEALLKAHRSDLIGFDAKCLIRLSDNARESSRIVNTRYASSKYVKRSRIKPLLVARPTERKSFSTLRIDSSRAFDARTRVAKALATRGRLRLCRSTTSRATTRCAYDCKRAIR